MLIDKARLEALHIPDRLSLPFLAAYPEGIERPETPEGWRTLVLAGQGELLTRIYWESDDPRDRIFLSGANLRSADLRSADLRSANLGGAKINWNSHDLLAELLRREAGDDIEKRKIAGLILISRDWCWRQFWGIQDPLRDWVIKTFEPYALVEDSNAPALLLRAIEALNAGQPVVVAEADDDDSDEE